MATVSRWAAGIIPNLIAKSFSEPTSHRHRSTMQFSTRTLLVSAPGIALFLALICASNGAVLSILAARTIPGYLALVFFLGAIFYATIGRRGNDVGCMLAIGWCFVLWGIVFDIVAFLDQGIPSSWQASLSWESEFDFKVYGTFVTGVAMPVFFSSLAMLFHISGKSSQMTRPVKSLIAAMMAAMFDVVLLVLLIGAIYQFRYGPDGTTIIWRLLK